MTPSLVARSTLSVLLLPLLLAGTAGCAPRRVSSASLDRVHRPAFISRIEEGAGARSRVFRDDETYRAKLKGMATDEADRRLARKLVAGATRFYLSERLRATTQAALPREAPWTQALDPARVATALESFLVEEVPADAPDYQLLRPLGADAVVELVIEDYGMRSDKGHAGVYLRGSARLFTLPSQEVLWSAPFERDQLEAGAEHLDPFRVAKDPELFRTTISELLDEVATEVARGLSPERTRRGPGGAPDALPPPGAEPPPAPPPADALPEGELPDPDPVPPAPVPDPS